jgi:hypothetical protein
MSHIQKLPVGIFVKISNEFENRNKQDLIDEIKLLRQIIFNTK